MTGTQGRAGVDKRGRESALYIFAEGVEKVDVTRRAGAARLRSCALRFYMPLTVRDVALGIAF